MNKRTLQTILRTTILILILFLFPNFTQQVKAQNIVNLNFGINNSYPWILSVCGDVRMDNGITNKAPLGQSTITTNSSCLNPGLVLAGNGSVDFGQGQASSSNQVVGGSSYPEVYTPAGSGGIFTSYSYLSQKATSGGLTATNLATVCTLTNCTLPVNLAHGIYQANGNVTLNNYTFRNNEDFVFLINGNLTINGNILTPNSATSIFVVSGNIIIPPTVGSPIGVTTANLSGVFSTDRSLILQSNNNCTDLRLNVEGTLIVNAGRTGSSLQNLRDLCSENGYVPTLQITQRLDYVLNLPDIIKIQTITSQEVAP